MTATTTPKARAPRKEKVVTPITINRIKPGDYMRNIFAATVPTGVTLADIQDGKYWTNIAKTLHITDRIEVVSEDGSFFAELYVTSVVQSLVRVKLMRHVDLTSVGEIPVGEESEFEVKFRGQIAKHTVQNKKTKEVIKDGFSTQAEAKQWLLSYETGLIK